MSVKIAIKEIHLKKLFSLLGHLEKVLRGIIFGFQQAFKPVAVASLNILKQGKQKRHIGHHALENYYLLLEAALIGIISALAALLLKEGISLVGQVRLSLVSQFGPFILPLFGLILGGLAGSLIERFAPTAGGGGIPQVKAALANFPVPLSLRVSVVKLLATILVLGGGLTLGRRGPSVHIGAALAAQLSNWVPTSPQHRRHTIAAGAAAGLAAGFNTPIAGVLFVVEELSRDMSGLTLETAILASFTGAVVGRWLGAADLNLPATLIAPGLVNQFTFGEIPFYLLLGVLAGVLGTFLNRSVLFTVATFRRLNWPMMGRIGLAGLISGTIIAFAPPEFRDNAGLRDFLITGAAGEENTAIALISYFCLTAIAYGSGAPGGLFAPALVLGSSLGYFVGDAEIQLLGIGSRATCALVGMGAFFTAVARVPVTAIVIIFELTTDFKIVLPLMITSVVSYCVAESIKKGSLYQHLLEGSGIKLQDDGQNKNDPLSQLTAAMVMQRQVETLPLNITLEDTFKVFAQSSHHGFPIVDQGHLVGVITDSHLANLRHSSPQTLLQDLMTQHPVTVPPAASLSDVLYLMDRYHLSHLPVTEGRKLVGIITRSDLIHATAGQLQGNYRTKSYPEPSYLIYQTRSPATGKGRILLPLTNPNTAPALVKIAAAIAFKEEYELECLHTIIVPRHSPPSQTVVDTFEADRLLERVKKAVQNWDIPVHLQVRIAQDAAQTILETISDRHINLLLMGWKGNNKSPGHIFGNVVDKMIQQAPCDVILIKLGNEPESFPQPIPPSPHWLIPMAGGPNVERALELLPSLQSLVKSAITLCHVSTPDTIEPDYSLLDETATKLESTLKTSVKTVPLCSYSVADATLELAQARPTQLIIVGASREGLLRQAIQGNIPEAIASGIDTTVILVRSAKES